MVKSISKGDVKDIVFGALTYDKASIVPCDLKFHTIAKGVAVNLAYIDNCTLKVIKQNIGIVVDVGDNTIKVKFNSSFGYDDKIYALITHANVHFTPLTLVYKENSYLY